MEMAESEPAVRICNLLRLIGLGLVSSAYAHNEGGEFKDRTP